MIKKLIYIIIFSIIFGNQVYARTENTALKTSKSQYSFSKKDENIFLQKANKNIIAWEKAKSDSEKKFYLHEAMRYYYLLAKANKESIEAQIGLGRVYDALKLDRFAKEHFFNAYNCNSCNPKMNLYFADYYYKRNDLISALNYYNMALKYGYSNSYYLNYRIGVTYEKLADIENAKKFYKIALSLYPQNSELTNKISLLEDLNYSQSQYYIFNEKKSFSK